MVKKKRALRKVTPFLAVAAVIGTAGMLLFAMYFTDFNLQWITFLGGILAASLLAMVVRATRAEFFAARRLARLSLLQNRLSHERKRRDDAEKLVAALRARLVFSDEEMPLMVAYVDPQARYRYHNRAFGEWVGLRKDRIDGRHMREVHGRKGFSEIEAAVAKVMDGEIVRFKATQKMPSGAVHRLESVYLPHFGDNRKLEGFYMLITDLIDRQDAQAEAREAALPDPETAPQTAQAARAGSQASGTEDAVGVGEARSEHVSQEATVGNDAVARIAAAIKKGEFALFCQPIRALEGNGGRSDHYEIFVRLLEEESNLIPPGAFFPLAEEYGLLPKLDRWVVQNLAAWIASRKRNNAGREGEQFFVNVALDTMCDQDFPDFVDYELRRNGVDGTMCFEVPESSLDARRGDVERFIRLVRQAGCRIALSGFGRERVAVDLLKNLSLDFLKIDGSVILGIERDGTGLAKVIGINRIAKVIGVGTIAEMVESEATIAKLREIKVDFAQGFGIAKPRPLSTLSNQAR